MQFAKKSAKPTIQKEIQWNPILSLFSKTVLLRACKRHKVHRQMWRINWINLLPCDLWICLPWVHPACAGIYSVPVRTDAWAVYSRCVCDFFILYHDFDKPDLSIKGWLVVFSGPGFFTVVSNHICLVENYR